MNYLHRAWAEIDLDALLHNFKTIKSHTNAKIFSVVKANAYGHSVSKIAQLLQKEGTDFFAVSNIDEADELRCLGIEKPILILGYTPPFLAEKLIKLNITQTVFSLDYAEELNRFANSAGSVINAHLKLDTGMGRLGFDCRNDKMEGLLNAKKALSLEGLKFEGVFTHFAVADSEKKKNRLYTDSQYSRFINAVNLLESDGFKFSLKHCCNSAATLLSPDKHLDAIRPGNILYGLTPEKDLILPFSLEPVMTFKAAVSMVKTLDKNETVNYGRTFKAKKPIKLATITAGYADGFPRLLSNRGYVLINGQRALIVGRICMDQFCADVSQIDEVKPGDEVILFGKELPVENVAKWANTINYEIVCGLSKRVPRIYIENGKEMNET